LNHHNQEYTSKQYPIDKVVDKVGTGDCFMAGIIFGLYSQLEPTKMIEFSSAAAVGKHAEAVDHTSQSKNDVYSKILL
jgi:2-dehydro-3-deoxygluconokinase